MRKLLRNVFIFVGSYLAIKYMLHIITGHQMVNQSWNVWLDIEYYIHNFEFFNPIESLARGINSLAIQFQSGDTLSAIWAVISAPFQLLFEVIKGLWVFFNRFIQIMTGFAEHA